MPHATPKEQAYDPAIPRKRSIVDQVLRRNSPFGVQETTEADYEDDRRPSASRAQLGPYVLMSPQVREGTTIEPAAQTYMPTQQTEYPTYDPVSGPPSEPVSPFTTTCARDFGTYTASISQDDRHSAISALPPLTRMEGKRPEQHTTTSSVEPSTQQQALDDVHGQRYVCKSCQPGSAAGPPFMMPVDPNEPESKPRMRLGPHPLPKSTYIPRPSVTAAASIFLVPTPHPRRSIEDSTMNAGFGSVTNILYQGTPQEIRYPLDAFGPPIQDRDYARRPPSPPSRWRRFRQRLSLKCRLRPITPPAEMDVDLNDPIIQEYFSQAHEPGFDWRAARGLCSASQDSLYRPATPTPLSVPLPASRPESPTSPLIPELPRERPWSLGPAVLATMDAFRGWTAPPVPPVPAIPRVREWDDGSVDFVEDIAALPQEEGFDMLDAEMQTQDDRAGRYVEQSVEQQTEQDSDFERLDSTDSQETSEDGEQCVAEEVALGHAPWVKVRRVEREEMEWVHAGEIEDGAVSPKTQERATRMDSANPVDVAGKFTQLPERQAEATAEDVRYAI